jgi:hypothetical protein
MATAPKPVGERCKLVGLASASRRPGDVQGDSGSTAAAPTDRSTVEARAQPQRPIHWQPLYSVRNTIMVEAEQLQARTEGMLLDPVYTGKIMASLIGLAHSEIRTDERVIFIHAGSQPTRHADEQVELGEVAVG